MAERLCSARTNGAVFTKKSRIVSFRAFVPVKNAVDTSVFCCGSGHELWKTREQLGCAANRAEMIPPCCPLCE
jgi:hypothetical protein